MLSFTLLFNKGNKRLSFGILNILINLTVTKKGEMLFGNDENIILNIATFLGKNKNDIIFLEYGILLIKHMTCKNSLVKQILVKYNIIDFFNEIYQKFVLNGEIMEDLIICLGHFIDSRFDKNKDILYSISIIKSQLNKSIPTQSLVKYVYILYNLALYKNDVIIKKMIDEDIHKTLMELFPFNEEKYVNTKNDDKFNYINNIEIKEKDSDEKDFQNLRLLIIKLLTKLLGIEDDGFTQKIIDSGLCLFLNKLLEFSDIKIIKNAFFCIQNICCGSYGQIAQLYDNKTIKLTLLVARNVNETLNSTNQFINNLSKKDFVTALKEIDRVFSLLIINSLFDRLIPLVEYDNYLIILLLLESFKYLDDDDKKDNDLISLIVRAISKLLDFFKNNSDEKGDNIALNNFIKLLEKNGFKEILGKMQYNSDEEIMIAAEKIFDEYFDINDDNNSDKININDIIEDYEKED